MCTQTPPLRPGFYLGGIKIDPPVLLAPMAGITDLPFRNICKRFGVGLTITEMIAARAIDCGQEKTRRMADIGAHEHPVAVQIAGSDPAYMRAAAQWAVERGADFVDINMGCPVKKVVKQLAGSALLRDELLVARVLTAVVEAVTVPVTLKIRTGWDEASKNVQRIAKIAEECGVQMLTVHGRTRAQKFNGRANWQDIRLAKEAVGIAVIGNGDVCDGASARALLATSGCDGVMVGRAVCGNPWVLAEIGAAIKGGQASPPAAEERWQVIAQHLTGLKQHHGERRAALLARKHLLWYCKGLAGAADFRRHLCASTNWQQQWRLAEDFFLAAAAGLHRAA